MHLLGKLTLAAPLLALTTPLIAGVLVNSPANGSTVTTPVIYTATATTTTCSKGVGSMGVYVDNKLIDVVDGVKLSVSLPVAPGKHETAVEEWDHCGGAAFTKLAITVDAPPPPPAAATPRFSVAAGTYTSAQSVTLSDATAGATIYYTVNGSTPTTSSTQYLGAISVSATEIIKAIAVATGYSSSAVASANYTITPLAATPTFSIAPGTYTSAQSVSLSDSTAGSTIYYTTNGSTPTTSSTQYSGAIQVTATETIEAVAAATGYTNSGLARADYHIGASYYLAPAADGGNDSNDGLSPDAPWLSPNHSVNCGDVILAAASTSYSSANFGTGNWGNVTCPSGNNVAWLTCVTFDGCKIVTNVEAGIYVDHSFWGVQGWEVTTTSGAIYGGCFFAAPNYANPVSIHHVIFANDIANGCQANGLSSFNYGTTASVDYFAIVGSIAYNAAQSNTECHSGISIYQPIASDSQPGTHLYAAGNFSWGNFDPNPCAGGTPTDGEGIIFDTFDGSQGGFPSPYRAQAVAENNILFANGGRGLSVANNNIGTPPFASIYLNHNTIWGNNQDTNQDSLGCGELTLVRTSLTEATNNLVAANSATGCGANPIYALSVMNSDGTDQVDSTFAYSPGGLNTMLWDSGTFAYGPNNLLGTNPRFTNPVNPGAPNCSGYANVPACMATVIANFTPTNSAAAGYGYQIPSSTPVYDPLFPQWLCNVNLPPGLVAMGCMTQP
jgi:hypothetical protein